MSARTLRDAQRLATRRLLVDAAVRVFARIGYARSTVDEIAQEAGASRATFYLHFKTKADLLEPLVERTSAHFIEPYARLGRFATAPDEAAITTWMRQAMQEWSRVEDFLRPVFEATDGDPELLGRLFSEPLPGVRLLARALVEARLVAADEDAQTYAAVLLSPVVHYLRQHLRKSEFDRERVAAAIARSWHLTLADLAARRTPKSENPLPTASSGSSRPQ